jgi:uncharacterized iron-regulated protein
MSTVTSPASGDETPSRCPPAGSWIAPPCSDALAPDQLIAALAERPIVLLGEQHDDADHHLWQLAVLGALYGRRPDLVLGFEAFPRRVQPVLDRWVAGELGEAEFLEQTDWKSVWGYDAALYMPLFRFARMFKVPMVALNVERAFIRAVGENGFAAVPLAAREGIGDPVAPPAAYRDRLTTVYGWKAAIRRGEADYNTPPHLTAEQKAAIEADTAFQNFVEAQTAWDRAMAEALAAAHRQPGAPLVVGIVGRGHVERRWGIPHQLSALGIAEAAVLLAERAPVVCAGLDVDLADAVFILPAAATADVSADP